MSYSSIVAKSAAGIPGTSSTGASDGHLDNPDGTKRFGRRPHTCKLPFWNYHEKIAGSTKFRAMPYGRTVLNILESKGVPLDGILGIQEFYKERFYTIEFRSQEAMDDALEKCFDIDNHGAPFENHLSKLAEQNRTIRRRLGGVPASVDLLLLRNAIREALPPTTRLGRIQRMMFPAFKSKKGTDVPAMPSGEVLIDFDVDVEHDKDLPEAIWLDIGGRHEGFGLLREGRNMTKRKRPNLRNVPRHLLEREQTNRIASIWAAPGPPPAMPRSPSTTPTPPTLPTPAAVDFGNEPIKELFA